MHRYAKNVTRCITEISVLLIMDVMQLHCLNNRDPDVHNSWSQNVHRDSTLLTLRPLDRLFLRLHDHVIKIKKRALAAFKDSGTQPL